MDLIKFGADDVENLVAQDPSRLDRLPFGAMLLDVDGRVKRYNEHESSLSGRAPSEVLGKNFFEDIAPCTKGHQFQGRFERAVKERSCNVMFEYVFDYKMTPTKVLIHMTTLSIEQGIWVFIKRL